MKRFVGFVVLIVLQLGTAVGWLAYGAWEETVHGENWIQNLELSPEERQMQENLALWYNLNLNNAGEGVPQDGYGQILFLEDGLMCCVEFPQREIMLPVWHGASGKHSGELTHLSRSALPLGGMGNHTVLTCAEESLDGLTLPKKEDLFVIHTLGNALTYRVKAVERSKRKPEVQEGEADKALCSIWIRADADWVIIRGVREYPQGEKGENIG